MPPLSQMVPVTSVDTIAAHALKMGWMEKESEESYFGASWHKKFVVLTGWDDGEAHLFYYDKENSSEASGVLFVNDMTPDEEGKGDAKVITLQGTQRRFRFRCTGADEARSWRHAITEAKMNGGHCCKTGVAAIAWMAEKHAKTCDKCRQIFTATNKKHHCRCCGRIFCNDCSNAPKINLEPFPIVVRCCNRCNDTQLRLVKEAKERAERARLFVQNHLGLLEEGGEFDCIHRSDILRTLVLDGNTGMSLQYRKLEVQEAIHPDAAARVTQRMAEDSKNHMSRIKAATMRVGESVASLRPRHFVDAFKPAEAAKNFEAIKEKTIHVANNAKEKAVKLKDVDKNVRAIAEGITDLVEGPRHFEVEVRHIQGVLDYAKNPTMMEKFPGEIAGRTFAIQIKSAHVPLELVALSVEEKCAWVHALTELAALSDDTGTEVLLVQKRSADVNAEVKRKLQQRKQDRTSAVLDNIKASTIR